MYYSDITLTIYKKIIDYPNQMVTFLVLIDILIYHQLLNSQLIEDI